MHSSPPRATPNKHHAALGTRWQKEKAAAGEGAFDYPDDAKYIGPWIIGECVGKGASGRVKIAKHRHTGQLAAVKILPIQPILNSRTSLATQQAKSDKQLLGIDREITMMKLMTHPNIMRIYDVYEGDKELYLVLEYVEGGELFDFLVNRGRLHPFHALLFFKQIIWGLNYAHTFSIIHRDLKPENILIASLSPPVIKIADWGMAAFSPPEHKLETSCGSPHYASPEIVNGSRYNGHATDIWSCGVILFALLSGRLPFDDPNVRKLLTKVKTGEYEMSSAIDPIAGDLIRRMLTVDVNKRITIPEIMQHEWFRVATPTIVYEPAPTIKELARPLQSVTHIDSDLLASLMVIWGRQTDCDDIKNDLLSPPGYGTLAKAFYFLLEKYRERTLKDSEADKENNHMADGKTITKQYTAPLISKSHEALIAVDSATVRVRSDQKIPDPARSPTSDLQRVSLVAPQPLSIRLNRPPYIESRPRPVSTPSSPGGVEIFKRPPAVRRSSVMPVSLPQRYGDVAFPPLTLDRGNPLAPTFQHPTPKLESVERQREELPFRTIALPQSNTLTNPDITMGTTGSTQSYVQVDNRGPSMLNARNHNRQSHFVHEYMPANFVLPEGALLDNKDKENAVPGKHVSYFGHDALQMSGGLFAKKNGLRETPVKSKQKEKRAAPPALDLSGTNFKRVNASGLASPTLTPAISALASPVIGEFKGWFSNLFNWKAQTYVLCSTDDIVTTRIEATRLLEQFGIVVALEHDEGCGQLHCRFDDVYDPVTHIISQKQTRFRVELCAASGYPASPVPGAGDSGTPRLQCQQEFAISHFTAARYNLSKYAMGGSQCAIVLIQERGAVSTFKNICRRLREEWTLDALQSPMITQHGAASLTAQMQSLLE